MGVSNSDINATFQRITLDVRVGGRILDNVVGISTSEGLSQINAQATITCTSRPADAIPLAAIEVWAGYNGNTDLIFAGELSGRVWRYAQSEIGLDARDQLARTRLEWGGEDREYTEQDTDAIIRNLLEAMGIPSSAAHIEGSGWTLGIIEPVIAPGGRAFQGLISEIDDLEGYRTFTRSGVIYRLPISGNVGTGAAWEYEQGVNIISIERKETLDGIVNRCIVTGLTYSDLLVGGPGVAEASADNPYVPDPPRYITRKIQSNLIEDDPRALLIAQRTVNDNNRAPTIYEIEAVFNPKIHAGSVIHVISDQVETGSAYLVVDRVQHTIRGSSARTRITTLGQNIVATPTNLPPIAAFDIKLFQEAEDTGSGVNSIIVGIADASASSDPDGDSAALTFAWTLSVDAGTVTPETGTGGILRFVVEGAATSLTIAVTATDTGGATNILSRVVPIVTGTLYVEDLYTAEGTVIAASSDGELNWNEQTIPGGAEATCLAPFAPAWGQVWGTSNGHIYASIDRLKTAPVDLGAPHGTIACTAVWVHETNQSRVWAAFADGAVYQGIAVITTPSVTWTARTAIPDGPVNEIREAIGTIGSLRATAGAGYYRSENAGDSWALEHSFDTAWRMAAGFDTVLASGLNDAAPIYAELGTVPTAPVGVTHIRGLTFGWRQKILYATDDNANLYATDNTLAALTLHTDTLPAIGNQMIRSGNADGVVYIPCGDGTGVNNGAVKWIPDTRSPWYIRKTTSRKVYMIAYGAAHLPVANVDFVFLPFAESDTTKDKWHRYRDGAWTSGPLPQSGWKWCSIKVHPTNTQRWLILGYPASVGVEFDSRGPRYFTDTSPLWISEDAGATWSEITLPVPSDTPLGDGELHLYAIAWQEQSGRWAVCGRSGFGASLIFTGGGAADITGGRGTLFSQLYYICGASGGSWLVSQEDAPGGGTIGGVVYFNNTLITNYGCFAMPEAGFNQPRGVIDVAPSPSRAMLLAGTFNSSLGIIYEPDYANTGAHPGATTVGPTVSGNYVWCAMTGDGVAIASQESGSEGFYVASGTSLATILAGSPSHATYRPWHIRTSRGTRRTIVGYGEVSGLGDYQFSVFDGAVWQNIAFPISGMNTIPHHYDTAYDVIAGESVL